MKTTAKRGFVVLFLVAAVLWGMVFLGVKFAKNAEDWAMLRANSHLMKNGSFTAAGNILDRNGTVLAETKKGKRVYNNSERIRRSTLHIVGDSEGYIASGVQTAYQRELVGYSAVNGIFSLKKYGRGNDVKLTLDSELCAASLDALDGEKGVVAVYNYKTGELLASVSSPNFDIRNKPDVKDIEKGSNDEYSGLYINRLIDGLYTPGSVFKIITSAAAVDNNIDLSKWSYTCDGECYINGVKVACPSAHGKQDLKKAFRNSCNCAYAELAVEIGSDALTAEASRFGFGKSFKFGNKLTEKSRFNLKNCEDSDLAWAGVGQFTTLANPYHMLTVAGAVANNGTAVLPYAVDEVLSPSGKIITKNITTKETYISEDTAAVLAGMMRNNVRDNYGEWRFPGLSMCGKTGTAEVSDDKSPHAWFLGFSQNDECPLAIVVVIENGGWGAEAALPVASAVMKEAYKLFS